jgi:hypothetical protein
LLNIGVGSGNYVYRDQLAYAIGGGGTGIGGGFYGTYVAANHYGYQAAAYVFFANQGNVCRLNHGISRLNRTYQTLGLNHSESY